MLPTTPFLTVLISFQIEVISLYIPNFKVVDTFQWTDESPNEKLSYTLKPDCLIYASCYVMDYKKKLNLSHVDLSSSSKVDQIETHLLMQCPNPSFSPATPLCARR